MTFDIQQHHLNHIVTALAGLSALSALAARYASDREAGLEVTPYELGSLSSAIDAVRHSAQGSLEYLMERESE